MLHACGKRKTHGTDLIIYVDKVDGTQLLSVASTSYQVHKVDGTQLLSVASTSYQVHRQACGCNEPPRFCVTSRNTLLVDALHGVPRSCWPVAG